MIVHLLYSDSSWNHGTVPTNPNYIWWSTNQWKFARGFLIIPAPSWWWSRSTDSPPLPQTDLLQGEETRGEGRRRCGGVTWRRGVNSQFYWEVYRRQTWTFRVVPDTWQHWPYKPSRQKTAVSMVHWYSVTGRLFWRSLKQPSITITLSGILYEKRPHTARSRVASETTEEGTLWCVTQGSPRFKLTETYWLGK